MLLKKIMIKMLMHCNGDVQGRFVTVLYRVMLKKKLSINMTKRISCNNNKLDFSSDAIQNFKKFQPVVCCEDNVVHC